MNWIKSILCAASVITVFSAGNANAQQIGEDGAYRLGSRVSTALSYSKDMFDRQDTVTNKIARALRARRSGELQTNQLYLGAHFIGTVFHEHTNTAGKFPILSRLPPSHTTGFTDTYPVVSDFSLNATLTLPLVTAFLQGEYTEIAYRGQDRTQWRKAWVAVGELDRSPFYAAFGRNTVNFGNFATYAPFTHSHSAHYFWAQTKDPHFEFGFINDRTEIAVSILPNDRGRRVTSSPTHNGDYENYAINAAHRFPVSPDLDLTVGVGYLRGTIYDSVIAHHPPAVGIDRSWNGAWNVNTTLSGRSFDVMAEFTQTEHIWPATGSKVSALNLQGRYRAQVLGRPATYSLSVSRGKQGMNGTEWEDMLQVVLGFEMDVHQHLSIGAEYLFNDGFVPLIMPTVVSDSSVKSDTVILGAKVTF